MPRCGSLYAVHVLVFGWNPLLDRVKVRRFTDDLGLEAMNRKSGQQVTRSKEVTPETPPNRFCQKPSLPISTGEITPSPVITTLRFTTFPLLSLR